MEVEVIVVVRKRGRPKVYVTEEQIAERRKKRLEYLKEYNNKRRHPEIDENAYNEEI